MGDRGQVLIEASGVYLYTHWGSHDLPQQVARALGKHARWDDHEYLTRIIFDSMTEGSNSETTGFGIGTAKFGDINRLVRVDTDDQIISIEEYDWSDGWAETYRGSFERFIREMGPDDAPEVEGEN